MFEEESIDDNPEALIAGSQPEIPTKWGTNLLIEEEYERHLRSVLLCKLTSFDASFSDNFNAETLPKA